jgi:hypothetical protein
MSFSIPGMVDSEMTPIDFVRRAPSAFFLWPNALLDEHFNHALLANLVQHTCSAVTRAAGTGMCLSVGRRCRNSVSAWAQFLSRALEPGNATQLALDYSPGKSPLRVWTIEPSRVAACRT